MTKDFKNFFYQFVGIATSKKTLKISPLNYKTIYRKRDRSENPFLIRLGEAEKIVADSPGPANPLKIGDFAALPQKISSK